MFLPNKFRLPDRGDQDVGRARDLSQALGCANGPPSRSRLRPLPFRINKKRQRFSHDHAAAENDNVRAGNFDPALDEQPLTAQRRARNKPAFIAERELRDIHRMKTVHVLRRIERAHDRRFIDLLRRRRLNENAVNRRIAIQFFHAREQFSLRRLCRQLELHRMQPEIAAHLVLRAHIGARGRIVADQDDGEARRHSALFQFRDFAAQIARKLFRQLRGLRSVGMVNGRLFVSLKLIIAS